MRRCLKLIKKKKTKKQKRAGDVAQCLDSGFILQQPVLVLTNSSMCPPPPHQKKEMYSLQPPQSLSFLHWPGAHPLCALSRQCSLLWHMCRLHALGSATALENRKDALSDVCHLSLSASIPGVLLGLQLHYEVGQVAFGFPEMGRNLTEPHKPQLPESAPHCSFLAPR